MRRATTGDRVWKAVRSVLDLAMVAAVIYIIYLLATGRLYPWVSSHLGQQGRIIQLQDYRSEFTSDIGSIATYKNQLSNMPIGDKRDALVSDLGEVQTRCRVSVQQYNELAQSFSNSDLTANNLPVQLSPFECM